MTIAEKIKHYFHNDSGNIRATEDFHAGDTLILRGTSLGIATIRMGAYWRGDQCLFSDGSYIDFNFDFITGEEG